MTTRHSVEQDAELILVDPALLHLSTTSAQAERRAHFNKAELADLADSMKAVGQLQPIVCRPMVPIGGKGGYEIVCGERRYLAAKLASLNQVHCTVRALTDEQVIEVQLVENLQREGLHELAEAEGYDALMREHHLTVEDLVAKIGRSRAYVYARLKLTALCAQARAAFYENKISASVALLIARVPGADEQQRVLVFATTEDWRKSCPTYREVFEFIKENFLLKLSDAPFPKDDPDLVPNAGTCGACPMRTGNQPELFGDVKGADICTNPVCFREKKRAHVRRELARAAQSGEKVIRGAEAKRILPPSRIAYWDASGSEKQLRNGYARPADKCLEDPKKRSYAQIAGKDAPKVLLQNPDTGKVERVFRLEDIADRIKAAGVKAKPVAKDPAERREQDEEAQKQQRQIELTARKAVFRAVLAAAPPKLERADLEHLVAMSDHVNWGPTAELCELLGWEPPPAKTRKGPEDLLLERLPKVSDAELARIALAIQVIDQAMDTYDDGKLLEALAKRLGVEVKKIREQALVEPQKAERPAAKAAKKPRKGK